MPNAQPRKRHQMPRPLRNHSTVHPPTRGSIVAVDSSRLDPLTIKIEHLVPVFPSRPHRRLHLRLRSIGLLLLLLLLATPATHSKTLALPEQRKEKASSSKGEMFAYQKGGDIEAGTSGGAGAAPTRGLYPGMTESPELRWALIRKIYVILSLQLLLTAVVAAVVVKVRAIPHFFVSTNAGFGLYIFLIIFPFIVLCPLYFYRQKHPVNLLLLAVFTIAISFAVGMTCAFTSGKVILEAAILTTAVVFSLTAYTFWAARRGQDFSFLGPFLFASLIMLLVFGFIQILFPLGKLSHMIYGALAALIFSGYIVYDTDNIIKRFTYDEYVWAAVSLYLDVINLFLALLTLFRAGD